jgi:hypothetical protein
LSQLFSADANLENLEYLGTLQRPPHRDNFVGTEGAGHMKNLKKLRTMVGRGQYWLAAVTGIERSRISLLENCHVRPTVDERAAIDQALITAMRENLVQFRQLSGIEVRAA